MLKYINGLIFVGKQWLKVREGGLQYKGTWFLKREEVCTFGEGRRR
ncbi:hypothetical protein AAGS61_12990 [Lysinibacillus sp. KU-BSD001]